MKFHWIGFLLCLCLMQQAQARDSAPVPETAITGIVRATSVDSVPSQGLPVAGLVAGNITDEKRQAIEGASVSLTGIDDSLLRFTTVTDARGEFMLKPTTTGQYRLRIIYTGLQRLQLDSIWVRPDRPDFQLADLVLKPSSGNNLGEVVIYAEKPLIQSSDGNITFNAGESALSAGSNASELLTMVPLVAKDADGKITVRGREPKILIDDKPVELNMQQLQDLLESLPGSAIEKIEVMTNPPPQYANEQGGVINITMRKGRVGKTGRVSVTAGSRGEASVNGSFNYRHRGLSISVNAGGGVSRLGGEGSSIRNNFYTDSSNRYLATSQSLNKSRRPNVRFNMDYDLDKFQSLNLVLQLNANDYNNSGTTTYTNYNRLDEIWRLSERTIESDGENYNGSVNASYLLRSKRPGEQLRITGSFNYSNTGNNRQFYEQFFNADHQPNGTDSVTRQLNTNNGGSFNVRINYDRPFIRTRTTLSVGGFMNRNNSAVDVDADYFRKSDVAWLPLDLLANRFRFHQTVFNYRGSLKQMIGKELSITGGLSVEQTGSGLNC